MDLKELENYCDHFSGMDFFYKEVLDVAINSPVEYPFLEIGTRAGGSALAFLRAICESGKLDRYLITVDPYGEMFYKNRGDNYGEKYRRIAMHKISDFCFEKSLNHFHMRLSSFQFLDAWKMFDFWDKEKKIEKKFSFVYFDGDHFDEVVKKELSGFYPYIIESGLFCVDDQNELNKYKDVIVEEPVENSNRLFYYKNKIINLNTNS